MTGTSQSRRSPDAPLTVLAVFGSVRAERAGIGLARLLVCAVDARGHHALLADLAEIRLPLLDSMYKEHSPGTAPEPMERRAGMIREADAVAVVSAEYNHGALAALENLLDHYLEEWFHKPCGICTYSTGRFGGVRAAMQLRMTLAELGMPTMPTLLPVPHVAEAVTPESGALDARLARHGALPGRARMVGARCTGGEDAIGTAG